MDIKLTQEDRMFLVELLNRVEMRGSEVPKYLKIVKAINAPILKDNKKNNKIKK